MGAKGLWWHTKRHKSCPILWRHYNAKKNLIESIILIRTFKENASTIQDFGAAYQMTSHCKEGTYLWELAVGIQMTRMVNVACSFLIRLGSTNLKEYGIIVTTDRINQCSNYHVGARDKIPLQHKKCMGSNMLWLSTFE